MKATIHKEKQSKNINRQDTLGGKAWGTGDIKNKYNCGMKPSYNGDRKAWLAGHSAFVDRGRVASPGSRQKLLTLSGFYCLEIQHGIILLNTHFLTWVTFPKPFFLRLMILSISHSVSFITLVLVQVHNWLSSFLSYVLSSVIHSVWFCFLRCCLSTVVTLYEICFHF
jgi:hypothetical protein